MYRQRLKGGHRVGAQQQQQTYSQNQSSVGNNAPSRIADVGWGFADESWGWGSSEVDSWGNSTSNASQQPPQLYPPNAAEQQSEQHMASHQAVGQNLCNYQQPMQLSNRGSFQPTKPHQAPGDTDPNCQQYMQQQQQQQYHSQYQSNQFGNQYDHNPQQHTGPPNHTCQYQQLSSNAFVNNNSNGTDTAWTDNWEDEWTQAENQQQVQNTYQRQENNQYGSQQGNNECKSQQRNNQYESQQENNQCDSYQGSNLQRNNQNESHHTLDQELNQHECKANFIDPEQQQTPESEWPDTWDDEPLSDAHKQQQEKQVQGQLSHKDEESKNFVHQKESCAQDQSITGQENPPPLDHQQSYYTEPGPNQNDKQSFNYYQQQNNNLSIQNHTNTESAGTNYETKYYEHGQRPFEGDGQLGQPHQELTVAAAPDDPKSGATGQTGKFPDTGQGNNQDQDQEAEDGMQGQAGETCSRNLAANVPEEWGDDGWEEENFGAPHQTQSMSGQEIKLNDIGNHMNQQDNYKSQPSVEQSESTPTASDELNGTTVSLGVNNLGGNRRNDNSTLQPWKEGDFTAAMAPLTQDWGWERPDLTAAATAVGAATEAAARGLGAVFSSAFSGVSAASSSLAAGTSTETYEASASPHGAGLEESPDVSQQQSAGDDSPDHGLAAPGEGLSCSSTPAGGDGARWSNDDGWGYDEEQVDSFDGLRISVPPPSLTQQQQHLEHRQVQFPQQTGQQQPMKLEQQQQHEQEQLELQQNEQQLEQQRQQEQELELQRQQEQELELQRQQEQELELQRQQEQELELHRQQEQELELQRQQEQELELQRQQEQELELQRQQEQELKLQQQQQLELQRQQELEQQQERQLELQQQQEQQLKLQQQQLELQQHEQQLELQQQQDLQQQQEQQLELWQQQEQQLKLQRQQEQQLELQQQQDQQPELQRQQEQKLELQRQQEQQLELQQQQLELRQQQDQQLELQRQQDQRLEVQQQQEKEGALVQEEQANQQQQAKLALEKKHEGQMMSGNGHLCKQKQFALEENSHTSSTSPDRNTNDLRPQAGPSELDAGSRGSTEAILLSFGGSTTSVAPPPVGGPFRNLRARKGSPFQPPKNISLPESEVASGATSASNVASAPSAASTVTTVSSSASGAHELSAQAPDSNTAPRSLHGRQERSSASASQHAREHQWEGVEEAEASKKFAKKELKNEKRKGRIKKSKSHSDDQDEDEDDEEGLPRFSRMVPGCGSSAEPQPLPPPLIPTAPPPMPTDRVVTGIDNPTAPPQPHPHGGSMAALAPQTQRTPLHPPRRSATIGSEESAAPSVQQRPPSNGSSSPAPVKSAQPPLSTSSGSPPQSPTFETSTYGRVAERRSPHAAQHHRRHRDHARYGGGYREAAARSGGEGTHGRNDSDTSRRRDRSYYHDQREGSGGGSRSSSVEGRDYPAYRQRTTGSGDDHEPSERTRTRRARPAPRRADDPYRGGEDSSAYDRPRRDRRARELGSRDWEGDSDWDHSRARRWDSRDYRAYYDRGYPAYSDYYKGSGGRRAPPSEIYDPQSYYYYYYQPYFEQHPKYRDYCHNYFKHYPHQYGAAGAPPSLPDERGSVRSGRSSAAEEVKKATLNSSRAMEGAPYYDPYGLYPHHQHDTSSQFMSDFHDRSSLGGYEPSTIYAPHQDVYHPLPRSGDVSGRASVDGGAPRPPSQRLTPALFPRPHTVTRFTNSAQLLVVLPAGDGPATTLTVLGLRDVLLQDPQCRRQIRAFEAFPGPLTPEDTHKDKVVRFCEARQQHYRDLCSSRGRSLEQLRSYALLWRYLALLVRQNGKLCPADLAALLVDSASEALEEDVARGTSKLGVNGEDMEDKPEAGGREGEEGERLTPSVSQTSLASSVHGPSTGSSWDVAGTKQSRYDSSLDVARPSRGDVSRCVPQLTQQQLERVTQQLGELVCLGRRRDAVELAIEHRLWGHAMAIGNRMEQAVSGRVLTAFLQCLPQQDVLHTLLQQVNGKRPDVSKSYSRSRWGEWRHHLATLVTNPSPVANRDVAAIVSLGDCLAASDIAAGHICYLMGGGLSLWGHKLQLLGADASATSPNSLDYLTSIQCTEVYEYGLNLASAAVDASDAPPSLVALGGFGRYKLRYAALLAECGFFEQAVRYCEVLAGSLGCVGGVTSLPVEEQLPFVAQLLELGTRLKYHDRHYLLGEGEIHDMPDPQWLTNLQMYHYHLQQHQEEGQQVVQSVEETQAVVQESRHLQQEALAPAVEQPLHNSAHFVSSNAAPPFSAAPETSGAFTSPDMTKEAHRTSMYDPRGEESALAGEVVGSNIPMVPTLPVEEHQPREEVLQQQRDAVDSAADALQGFSFQPRMVPAVNDSFVQENHSQGEERRSSAANYGEGGDSELSSPHFTPTHVPTQPYQPVPLPPYGLPNAGPPASSSPSHQPSQQQQQQQQQAAPAPPPPATTAPSGDGLATKSAAGADAAAKSDAADGEKKGLFSRIFGWKNNQAKLPDDKNPSIVWDEERKRWVNTDATEEEDAPPPPPPMDSCLPPAPAASRAGPRRARYVNPVDEKHMVKPASSLAPPLPLQTPVVPQQQQMMPQQQQMTPQQQQQQMMPQQQQQMMPQQQQQMMPQQQQPPTPAQHESDLAGGGGGVVPAHLPTGRTRSDSSSIDLDDPDASAAQDDATAAAGPPMFFNPAQFEQPPQQLTAGRARGAAASARRGRGGGPQRRIFPTAGVAPPPPRA